jgi:hypothetical protein
MKVLLDVKTGFEEASLLVRRKGCGYDALKTLLGQQAEAPSHELRRGSSAVRYGDQKGDGAVRWPRAGASSLLSPADDVAKSGHLSSR